jgi:hypothetical protein
MAQDDGRNWKDHTLEFSILLRSVFYNAFFSCQQHKSSENLVRVVLNGGSIQNGSSKSDFLA